MPDGLFDGYMGPRFFGLPGAARKETEQRQNENDDQDDPENAHIASLDVERTTVEARRRLRRCSG
jgi:hypothetical protein